MEHDMATQLATNDLAGLARRINDEHTSAIGAAVSALEHANECGKLLIEAKAQLKHGQWLPWLRENCRVKERQAQYYMRLAERWDRLDKARKNAPGADLTIKEALWLTEQSTRSMAGAPIVVKRIASLDVHWIVRHFLRFVKSHGEGFDGQDILEFYHDVSVDSDMYRHLIELCAYYAGIPSWDYLHEHAIPLWHDFERAMCGLADQSDPAPDEDREAVVENDITTQYARWMDERAAELAGLTLDEWQSRMDETVSKLMRGELTCHEVFGVDCEWPAS